MSKHVFGTWYPASDPPEVAAGSSATVIGALFDFERYVPIRAFYFNDCNFALGRPRKLHGFYEEACHTCEEYYADADVHFWMPMPSVDDLVIPPEKLDASDIESARDILRELKDRGTIPWEEVKRQLGLDAEGNP